MPARPKTPVEIYVIPQEVAITGFAGETLLSALQRAELGVNHSCGGNATCGTCRVELLSGSAPVGELEAEFRNERGFRQEERLSCQVCLSGPIKIRIL